MAGALSARSGYTTNASVAPAPAPIVTHSRWRVVALRSAFALSLDGKTDRGEPACTSDIKELLVARQTAVNPDTNRTAFIMTSQFRCCRRNSMAAGQAAALAAPFCPSTVDRRNACVAPGYTWTSNVLPRRFIVA